MRIRAAFAIALFASVALLQGCASMQPIGLGDLPPGQAAQLLAGAVSVVDLTKAIPEGSDAILSTGFNRIGDAVFARPPGEQLAEELRGLLKASGVGDALDVWVTDVAFYWEKTGTDFVPIVNLFSYQQSGRLKCDATIALRRGASSRKTTLEHFVPKIDTSNLQSGDVLWKNAARECYPALRAKVIAAVQSFR